MSVKWGVIGCGGIADRRTIPEGIMPARNAELAAVMDVNEDRMKEVSKKYGNVKCYLTEEELVNDKDVEAVYMATPVHLHLKQAGLADNCFCIPDASSENRLEIYGTKGSILAEGTMGKRRMVRCWLIWRKNPRVMMLNRKEKQSLPGKK